MIKLLNVWVDAVPEDFSYNVKLVRDSWELAAGKRAIPTEAVDEDSSEHMYWKEVEEMSKKLRNLRFKPVTSVRNWEIDLKDWRYGAKYYVFCCFAALDPEKWKLTVKNLRTYYYKEHCQEGKQKDGKLCEGIEVSVTLVNDWRRIIEDYF
jgi:hypothetical protein